MSPCDLRAQAAMILADRDDLLVELRAVHPTLRPTQVRQDFFDPGRLDDLERRAELLGGPTNVWIGAAPRTGRRGDREHVAPSRDVWADCDTSQSCEALRAFPPQPSLIVRTSTLDGERLQPWWWVRQELAPDELEHVLRRIAARSVRHERLRRPARAARDPDAQPQALGARTDRGDLRDRRGPRARGAARRAPRPHEQGHGPRAMADARGRARGRRRPLPGRARADRAAVRPRRTRARAAGDGRGVPRARLRARPAHPIELEPITELVHDFRRADLAAYEAFKARWPMTKTGRQLEPLPDYGADLAQWRDWLTDALKPAFGRVEDFVRHGRQRIDRCEIVILHAGDLLRFDLDEQRLVATPGTQRQSFASATDGLLRLPALTKAEQEDVWTALVTLATVTANQDADDEARDWIEQAEERRPR